MYQLEVKRYLTEYRFPPSNGWKVSVHLDPMERAEGGQHSPDKKSRVTDAEGWLVAAGVNIEIHPEFGPADLVATKPDAETVVVEVEGDSSRQKEQALYSALGQIVLQMRGDDDIRFGLAVPDTSSWEQQLGKIPAYVREQLSLTLWLVNKAGVRELNRPE